ncbi:MAG: purine-nucleoside phosphorylase [Chloroflexota bacterium]|nr:purine-nucleoside phosphorylase [Chloroflexota bacterium]
MTKFLTRKEYEEAADFIRSRMRYEPAIGLVFGSGLAPLAEEIEGADVIPYGEIPHLPASTVEGHPGRLIVGRLAGRQVMAMQGRAHYYEGYSMQQVTLPIRAMQLLGVKVLMVTNAAGGLNPDFRAGDLMLITDHINLIGMAGLNPLRGPNDPQLGPRFPEMSQAYDLRLREIALEVAKELGITLHQGVYICLAGPSFETPADLRFLRMIGADAVGMSTVPEVTVARHADMRVLGISGISNVAVLKHTEKGVKRPRSLHQEVLEAGETIVPKMAALLQGVIQRIELE